MTAGPETRAATLPYVSSPAPRTGILTDGVQLMWTVFKALALRFAIGRTLGGMLATLFLLLVPIAGVLKVVGLPILIVLGVVGAPLFLLLAAIGLPVLVVVGFGAVLLLFVGMLLTLGLIALKIALPIILIVWLVKWFRGRKRGPSEPPADVPDAGEAGLP